MATIYISLFIFMPFIVLFMGFALAIALSYVGIYESCFKKCMKRGWEKRNNIRIVSLKFLNCPVRVLYIALYILGFTLLFVILAVFTVIFATLVTAFFMIPMMILYLFVIVRKDFVWERNKKAYNT